ncbi:hypothetical protein ANCCAN_24181 [Ancylostoma caninum]|uniref:Uncharacterized protein n=1 Tax=Ancylostoma caninum TaxID=29170 RepID=A0A368FDA8_ANCCA|nr:hypothetical protein ANCCAN_24181 [Ancylostoma caninum]
MSQIMFSDDDDVSKHAAELERIHETITTQGIHRGNGYLQEPSPTPFDADDCKENQSSCPFIDGDPIYRRILQERKRPLRDVFMLPFVPPSKTHDEYEFESDQDFSDEENDCSTSGGSRPPSTESCDACRSTPGRRSHSSLSASSTPLLDRRRRRRLQKLRDAVIATRTTASDDDQEFVPGLSTFESLLTDQDTLTMKLRPRKELWNADDELPLADVQLQVVLEQSKREAELASSKRSSEANLSTKAANNDSEEKTDFASLPRSDLCTPKGESKRKRSRLGTPRTGTSATIKKRQLKATQSAPSKRALKSSRSRNDSMERRFSDSDYDLPLAHFADASNDVSRRNGIRSSVKRKRGRRSSADGDYKGSDTEVPLSEIRRRYRSIRWADKLKRRRIDYTGMDWDE